MESSSAFFRSFLPSGIAVHVLDLNNYFVIHIEETHTQWGDCRGNYRSPLMERWSQDHFAMMLKVIQGHRRVIWKRCLRSCLKELEIWDKLGRKGSLTGIACFHRVAKEELLPLQEERLEAQKEAGTTAAFHKLLLCHVPLPVTALSFATAGGSMARRHPLPAGRPLSCRGEMDKGTRPNLLEGQKMGAPAHLQPK